MGGTRGSHVVSFRHMPAQLLLELTLRCGPVPSAALIAPGPSRRYRSTLAGTKVLPTDYFPGNHPMIIQHPIETPIMTSTKAQGRSDDSTSDTLPCHDLRTVGLESLGARLSATRADLGEVLEARAKADVVYCPVCPEPHPVV